MQSARNGLIFLGAQNVQNPLNARNARSCRGPPTMHGAHYGANPQNILGIESVSIPPSCR